MFFARLSRWRKSTDTYAIVIDNWSASVKRDPVYDVKVFEFFARSEITSIYIYITYSRNSGQRKFIIFGKHARPHAHPRIYLRAFA